MSHTGSKKRDFRPQFRGLMSGPEVAICGEAADDRPDAWCESCSAQQNVYLSLYSCVHVSERGDHEVVCQRVLYAANAAKIGGGNKVLMELMLNLDPQRYSPCIVAPGPG